MSLAANICDQEKFDKFMKVVLERDKQEKQIMRRGKQLPCSHLYRDFCYATNAPLRVEKTDLNKLNFALTALPSDGFYEGELIHNRLGYRTVKGKRAGGRLKDA